jgi:hypothetical protein
MYIHIMASYFVIGEDIGPGMEFGATETVETKMRNVILLSLPSYRW